MKELSGTAKTSVAATPEQCFELVAAIERYPSWLGDEIRRVEVLRSDSDSRAIQVRTLLHIAVGPLVRDFDLVMDVRYRDHEEVSLTRVADEPSGADRFEVMWHVESGPPTGIAIELTATLEVPRLVPLGGVGDRLAQGFVEAAKGELTGSSPNASASSS